jgi:hypothetical protein
MSVHDRLQTYVTIPRQPFITRADRWLKLLSYIAALIYNEREVPERESLLKRSLIPWRPTFAVRRFSIWARRSLKI